MPGNKKPKKKYAKGRILTRAVRPSALKVAGSRPIDAESILQVKTVNHLAMAAIAAGTAQIEDLSAVFGALQVAEATARLLYAGSYEKEIGEALNLAKDKFYSKNLVYTTGELEIASFALAVHDGQLDQMTNRELDVVIRHLEELDAKRGWP